MSGRGCLANESFDKEPGWMSKMLIVASPEECGFGGILVLISCHPVSQPSKRERNIFVGECFGGGQGQFNWAFSLHGCIYNCPV